MTAKYGDDLPEADWQTQHIEGYARAAMERGQNGYFSAPLISQIDDNLWVGGYLPVKLPHFDAIVSLYPWRRYVVDPNKTKIYEFTMYDAGETPPQEQLDEVADLINDLRAKGKVLVHCQAGLNRSNLVTAYALIKSGMKPADAIALLREKRSPAVLCNAAFESWLLYQDE